MIMHEMLTGQGILWIIVSVCHCLLHGSVAAALLQAGVCCIPKVIVNDFQQMCQLETGDWRQLIASVRT